MKSDKQTNKVNIIFEFRSNDKPIGILATQANLWVNIIPLLEEVWVIKVNVLKELLEQYYPAKKDDLTECWHRSSGGDGERTKVYI